MVDFRRLRPHLQPVSNEGVGIEMVQTYRYLGLELDDSPDWSSNALYRRRDTTRLDKLVRKAGSVVGAELDTLTSVTEKRIHGKIPGQCPPPSAPNLFQAQKLLHRLLSLACSTDRLRKSFVPRAIRLYNSSL